MIFSKFKCLLGHHDWNRAYDRMIKAYTCQAYRNRTGTESDWIPYRKIQDKCLVCGKSRIWYLALSVDIPLGED